MNHKFYNSHIFGEETTRLSNCTLLPLYLHVCFNFIYGMVGASDPEKFLVSNPMHLAKAAVPRPLVIQVRCDLKYEISQDVAMIPQCFFLQNLWLSMPIHGYPPSRCFLSFKPQRIGKMRSWSAKTQGSFRISAALRLHLTVHLGSQLAGLAVATMLSSKTYWPLDSGIVSKQDLLQIAPLGSIAKAPTLQ